VSVPVLERTSWLEARHLMVTRPKTLSTDARVEHVRAELDDDHVHLVLVVEARGRLVTTIERGDLVPELDDSSLASACGRLDGRTVTLPTPLSIIVGLLGPGRRRLAVVDDDGRLQGLVCLKRSGSGFCTDDDVRARNDERRAEPS
jgi:CBS domain-containing protein